MLFNLSGEMSYFIDVNTLTIKISNVYLQQSHIELAYGNIFQKKSFSLLVIIVMLCPEKIFPIFNLYHNEVAFSKQNLLMNLSRLQIT